MPDKISVYIKRPDVSIEAIEVPNTLEALQELVGGGSPAGSNIETVTMSKKMTAIFNKEGVLLNLPFNMYLGGHWLRGPVLFVGVDGDEFTDAPFRSVRQVESAIREFNNRR